MKHGKREWPMPITPADRAAGLRNIAKAKSANLWPEEIEELEEAARILDSLERGST